MIFSLNHYALMLNLQSKLIHNDQDAIKAYGHFLPFKDFTYSLGFSLITLALSKLSARLHVLLEGPFFVAGWFSFTIRPPLSDRYVAYEGKCLDYGLPFWRADTHCKAYMYLCRHKPVLNIVSITCQPKV